jgi:S-adenosylmethionine decarboxylase
MTMKALGIHLLIEFTVCNRQKIDNIDYLEKVMTQAAEVAGATVLKTAFQDFNPQGVSGVVVIAESHLTIHSWPEYGYAAIDIFTCGTKVDPWKAAEFLKHELEAGDMQVQHFPRGIPDAAGLHPASEGFIDYAPCCSNNCQ